MNRDDPVFKRGREIRGEMFGPGSQASLDQADDFQRPLQDLVTQYCFGEIWDRPHLPRAIRSMITIAMLVGQSRPIELRRHIKGAIANGVTKEQIREVLLHATLYAGIPAGSDGWAQATEALKEIGAY
jgi:4-carboxymuconolactone decarboxylase